MTDSRLPHPTPPPNTGDTDIDDLLQQFEHWIKQPNSILYRHHDFLRTKAAITKKLNEARIDELSRLSRFKLSGILKEYERNNEADFSAGSFIATVTIEGRIKALQATKENNHGDSA